MTRFPFERHSAEKIAKIAEAWRKLEEAQESLKRAYDRIKLKEYTLSQPAVVINEADPFSKEAQRYEDEWAEREFLIFHNGAFHVIAYAEGVREDAYAVWVYDADGEETLLGYFDPSTTTVYY